MADNPSQNAITALQNIQLAIAQQTKVINNVFPQSISTSLTATSGAILAKSYEGYLVVNNPLTNTPVKIGYYGV